MSHTVGTSVCYPAAFDQAVTAFQLTALADQAFFQGNYFCGFQPDITHVHGHAAIQREEEKIKRSLKESAAKGDKQVMQAMQALVRLPEIASIMQEMSKEMMRAGIIEEMLDETMSNIEDEEEMEEAAQTEVDKVLWELTQGKLGEAPAPPTAVGVPSTSQEVAEEPDESELDEMQTRLQALRS
ncbi:Charged multivesicular body protein 3 [Eumeta japonica]|uniref:Charged multivesicular body protein 3 n=1 Tax=Eumeta variegata TaxID=151549 RepID=A0A4C1SWF9_EUMVA|nr:Charged multivesicular body protein 3 [Eumeta japonica]